MSENRGLVRNFTYSEQARGAIKRLIFDGTYIPGQRLKEAEVSRELGISRAPTREAIQSLANEGLVEIVPHKGAVVTTFDARRVRELYEVREALEVMSARLAAEKSNQRQMDKLRVLLEDTADMIEVDETAPYPKDLNFHNHILELAGNPRLRAMAAEIYSQLRLAMLRSGSAPGRASEAYKEHAAVFEALRKKDPEQAEQAMRQHIRNGLKNVASILAVRGTA